MKTRMYKRIFIAVFALAISVLTSGAVFATESPFQLVNLVVGDKSADVEGDASLNAAGEIENNIVFHHVGSYVEYVLELQNTSSKKLTITDISDNNTNSYITYSYDDHTNEEIAAGASLLLKVKATYTNEVTNLSDRSQITAMKISINYKTEELVAGSTDVEFTVPDTGANTIKKIFSNPDYIVTAIVIIVAAGTVVILAIKRKTKLAMAICAFAFAFVFSASSTAEPAKVNEVAGGFALDFNADFELYDKLAVSYAIDNTSDSQTIEYGTTVGDLAEPERQGYSFNRWEDSTGNPISKTTPITGDLTLYPRWNLKIATLSVGCNASCGSKYITPQNGLQYDGAKLYNTTLISHFNLGTTVVDLFTRAPEKPSDEIIASAWNVAASGYPIYLWYDTDDNALYWWSEAGQVKLPQYSKYAFFKFPVRKIDLTGITATSTNTLEGLFMYSKAREIVFGETFDSKMVSNMNSMFYGASSLTSVDFENLNTKNTTNLSYMFNDSGLASIDFSNANFDNVYSFKYMFSNTPNLSSVKLPNITISSVDMERMFYNATGLVTLDLSTITLEDYECPNVENMFEGASNLTTIYVNESLDKYHENYCVMLEPGDPNYVSDFRIFDGADKLEGGLGTKYPAVKPEGVMDGTEWDQYYTPADESYLFRIDGGSSNPGMFTLKQQS